jgi:hypothetical protein
VVVPVVMGPVVAVPVVTGPVVVVPVGVPVVTALLVALEPTAVDPVALVEDELPPLPPVPPGEVRLPPHPTRAASHARTAHQPTPRDVSVMVLPHVPYASTAFDSLDAARHVREQRIPGVRKKAERARNLAM